MLRARSERQVSKLFQYDARGKKPWTIEEDNLLKKITDENGTGNWTFIAQHFAERSGKQCRERWHNHLNPGIKKGDWTAEEDDIIIRMQQQWGNQWAKITTLLPGRTDNAVKNRFHATLRATKGKRLTNCKSSVTSGFDVDEDDLDINMDMDEEYYMEEFKDESIQIARPYSIVVESKKIETNPDPDPNQLSLKSLNILYPPTTATMSTTNINTQYIGTLVHNPMSNSTSSSSLSSSIPSTSMSTFNSDSNHVYPIQCTVIPPKDQVVIASNIIRDSIDSIDIDMEDMGEWKDRMVSGEWTQQHQCVPLEIDINGLRDWIVDEDMNNGMVIQENNGNNYNNQDHKNIYDEEKSNQNNSYFARMKNDTMMMGFCSTSFGWKSENTTRELTPTSSSTPWLGTNITSTICGDKRRSQNNYDEEEDSPSKKSSMGFCSYSYSYLQGR